MICFMLNCSRKKSHSFMHLEMFLKLFLKNILKRCSYFSWDFFFHHSCLVECSLKDNRGTQFSFGVAFLSQDGLGKVSCWFSCYLCSARIRKEF